MKFLSGVIAYACISLVILQALGVSYLLANNAIDQKKMYSLMAIVYGIDEDKIREESIEKRPEQIDNEEPDMLAIINARAERHLALDFRLQAMDNGIENLQAMLNSLAEERRRYDNIKKSFDDRLQALEEGVRNEAILELQRTIEVIDPKQAKEQLLIMLDRDDNAMKDVVLLFKAMSPDKRKKIIAEFKSDEEIQALADILHQIRLGAPESGLIQQTRDDLEEFKPDKG